MFSTSVAPSSLKIRIMTSTTAGNRLPSDGAPTPIAAWDVSSASAGKIRRRLPSALRAYSHTPKSTTLLASASTLFGLVSVAGLRVPAGLMLPLA